MIEVINRQSSASRISLQPGADSPALLPLSRSEIIEGRVLQSSSLNNALLLIKGRRVMAKTHVPLSEGSMLSLRVQDVSPVPILRLIDIKSADFEVVRSSIILSAIQQNVWKALLDNIYHYGLPKDAISPFRELMSSLSMRLFFSPSTELLRTFIDQSGLRWESKLREVLLNRSLNRESLNSLIQWDLKGLTSKLLTLQTQKGNSLKRLVSTIQDIQLLNKFGVEQKGKIFLPIPIQFPDGHFTVGQLLIRFPRSQKDERKGQKAERAGTRITFLLELSRLGPLRADLTVKGKEIKGRFLLTNEVAKQRIEASIPMFVERMKQRGFSLQSLDCYCMDPKVVTQPLITEIMYDQGNTISVVV